MKRVVVFAFVLNVRTRQVLGHRNTFQASSCFVYLSRNLLFAGWNCTV